MTTDADVIVVGAGPVGLMLANLLALRGSSVIVLEARERLIDYPRGVGLDDESVRTIQTAGLWPKVQPHTVPHHVVRLVNGRGRTLVTNDPRGQDYGFARKHGFVQPLVDCELAAGLDRFTRAELRFQHTVVDLREEQDRIWVGTQGPNGRVDLSGRYIVGCEGGRSFTREWMGVGFEGRSPSTRWLVVDVENDPVGTPSVYLGADPRRPYVSIGLPHGIRRWEFMLHEDESAELVDTDAFVRRLLERHVPRPDDLQIIGRRVFTHHGRLAGGFRRGRVLLAGDAAHLMPVWLGQGWNSGIRDATNLAWKLSAVVGGLCDDALLDSYEAERRPHARDMIDINMTVGRLMTCGPVSGYLRDRVATAFNLVPAVKAWFTDLRFKPVPRYVRGVVVDQATLEPGRSVRSYKGTSRKRASTIAPLMDAATDSSPVGQQFVQPKVSTASDSDQLLDDVIGDGWAILAWGDDPSRLLGEAGVASAKRLGMKLVSLVPETQRDRAVERAASDGSNVVVVGDPTGSLQRWFDTRACSVVFIRPDRFVAAACLAQQTPQALAAVLEAAHAATRTVEPVESRKAVTV